MPSYLTPQTALGGESAPCPSPSLFCCREGQWALLLGPLSRAGGGYPHQRICMSVSLCQSTVLALPPPWPPPSTACTCSQHGLLEQLRESGCSRGTRRCSLAAGPQPPLPRPSAMGSAAPHQAGLLSSLSQRSCISQPRCRGGGPVPLKKNCCSLPSCRVRGGVCRRHKGPSEPLEQGPASSPCNGIN